MAHKYFTKNSQFAYAEGEQFILVFAQGDSG